MAKKDIGEMKRAAGFQNDFWTRFVDEYASLGGSAERLYALDQDGLRAAAQAAAREIVGQGGQTIGRHAVVVDPAATIESLRALREWTYFNTDITDANFGPPAHHGAGVIELVHLGRDVSTAEAERELAARGLQLPDMHDQMSFALQQPDAWAGKIIVFLGAVWVYPDGNRRVGLLGGLGGERRCNLGWGDPGFRWLGHCVFAGVRK